MDGRVSPQKERLAEPFRINKFGVGRKIFYKDIMETGKAQYFCNYNSVQGPGI